MDFNQQTTVGPTSSSTRQKIAGRAGVKRSPQKKWEGSNTSFPFQRVKKLFKHLHIW